MRTCYSILSYYSEFSVPLSSDHKVLSLLETFGQPILWVCLTAHQFFILVDVVWPFILVLSYWHCGLDLNPSQLDRHFGVLHCAIWLNLTELIVFGDSTIVIEWANDKGSLNSSALDPWKLHIKALYAKSHHISILHIYRTQNCEADSLSKMGCSSDPHHIICQKFEDGIQIGECPIPI